MSFSMLIGGIDSKNRYLNDVELYAPGLKCHQKKLPPYPLKVAGATGNLGNNGQIVICGGASHTYSGCTESPERTCKRNVECVITNGGSKWCSGPRTKECYTYE